VEIISYFWRGGHERSVRRDPNPVIGSNDVKYELAERSQAINYAGVSAMVKLAKHVGLVDGINKHVELLKCHSPHHIHSALA